VLFSRAGADQSAHRRRSTRNEGENGRVIVRKCQRNHARTDAGAGSLASRSVRKGFAL
jgi:hypothetical protein